MKIQIFGRKKCFDTKKAQRYFKERNIPYQFIDLDQRSISPGEYNNIKQALGGDFRRLIDPKSKAYESLYIAYQAYDQDVEQLLLENPALFRTPIVRNGKSQATIGYQPDVWRIWQ